MCGLGGFLLGSVVVFDDGKEVDDFGEAEEDESDK